MASIQRKPSPYVSHSRMVARPVAPARVARRLRPVTIADCYLRGIDGGAIKTSHNVSLGFRPCHVRRLKSQKRP